MGGHFRGFLALVRDRLETFLKIAAILLLVAAFAGVLVPKPAPEPPREMGEYKVLTGDFHIHMFPLDAATLSPWDVVVEARRRNLHVIALTGHNQVWTAKVGRWFAERTGGPMVIVGQEVITPPFDMIAVGIDRTIDFRANAAEIARRIHQQGGVAIAAHPLRSYWPAFDAAAMQELDGAEVLHPMRFVNSVYADELDEFFSRKRLTAIGSSDFHATGFPGFSRTYVFVRDITEAAVLDALREHRTVCVDRDGDYIGDSALIELARANGGLPPSAQILDPGIWGVISRYSALAAMALVCVLGFRRETSSLKQT